MRSEFGPEVAAELEALRERLRALELRLGTNGHRDTLPEGDFDVLLTVSNGTPLAFLLDQVELVVAAAELGRVPEAPDWMLGVLTLRGKAVPTIDIATRLGATGRRIEPSDLIVVTRTRAQDLGFVVQGVDDVLRVPRASLESTLQETPHAPYVLGTFPAKGRTVLLLGVAELLGQVNELTSSSEESAA